MFHDIHFVMSDHFGYFIYFTFLTTCNFMQIISELKPLKILWLALAFRCLQDNFSMKLMKKNIHIDNKSWLKVR